MITPLSFDPETAREMVGDADARVIEAKARADADIDHYDPPTALKTQDQTYYGQVQKSMRMVVYHTQYAKRKARNERKKT